MPENPTSPESYIHHSTSQTHADSPHINIVSNNSHASRTFRRGRPPRYASIQDRRDAHNARRRELRQIHHTTQQRTTEQLQQDIPRAPTNITTQSESTDPNQPTQCIEIPSFDVNPRATNRRGRPPRYASTEDHRNTTAEQRREICQIQHVVQPSNTQQLHEEISHVLLPTSSTAVNIGPPNLTSINLPRSTTIRRGRPPIYASTQHRRAATNARRRELRQLRRPLQQPAEEQNNQHRTSPSTSSLLPTLLPQDDPCTVVDEVVPQNAATLPTSLPRENIFINDTEHQFQQDPGQHNLHRVTIPPAMKTLTKPTNAQRDAINTRRRELRHLRQDALRAQSSMADQRSKLIAPNGSLTNSISNPAIIPSIVFRRRGRPPGKLSTQDRRILCNARRRELRQIQRYNNINLQGTLEVANELHEQPVILHRDESVNPASPSVVGPHSKIMDSGVQSLDFSDIPISEIKKKTSSRILLSMETIPHCFLTADARVDKLIELLSDCNSLPKGLGGKCISDFVIKAVALALQKVPQCNSLWMNDFIRQYHNVNINIVVQTKNGMYLPVIRDADKKCLSKLAEEAKDLAKKAEEDGLKPEDLEGGTFTVSSLGESLRIKQFCAINNPSQSCILTVNSEAEKRMIPGARPDQSDFGSFISVMFKCDHRYIDGAIGAEFLKAFKDYLEHPISMLPQGGRKSKLSSFD